MTEKLFRVILREYDDFPGHYHEYMDVVDCVVEADSEEQIREALHDMLEDCSGNPKLFVNNFKPFTIDQMVSHADKEFDGWGISASEVAE